MVFLCIRVCLFILYVLYCLKIFSIYYSIICTVIVIIMYHNGLMISSYYKSSSVCLFVCLSVCLSVCSLSPPRSFDRSSPNLVGVCRWTSELPLRGSFSKRSTARRVNGSLSLSTILYMCQPHSTQLQKATLLLLHLIRLKGTFCCIDGWWVYVGGSRNWLLDGSSMACTSKIWLLRQSLQKSKIQFQHLVCLLMLKICC